MATITVSDGFKKLVEKMQEKRGLATASEAADAIGHTFVGRVNAVKKYADAHKAEPKPKKAKAKKAKLVKKASKKAAPAPASKAE